MSRWRPGNVLRDFAIDERTAVRRLTLSAGAAVLVVCLAACGSDDPDPAGIKAGSPEGQKAVAEGTGTGTDTTGRLVESSPIAVVAAPDPASQALAASAAVGMRAPMLTAVAGHDDDVKNELERMKVSRVLRVGGATVPDGIEAVDAPADREGLQKVTGVTFHDEPAYPSDFVDDVIVHQHAEDPAFVTVDGAAPLPGAATAAPDVEPLGVHAAAWGGDGAPHVLVDDHTPLAAVATAVASGATVAHLRAPDPRVDGGAVEEVTTDAPILAVGPGWGDDDTFAEHVRIARSQTQLPGGGQLVFPGRRFVAAYGSPISPSLGVLGEQDPQASVAKVQQLVQGYQPFSPEPVVPAFEIIGTVASQDAGPDGNFTNEWGPEQFTPLVDAITAAGGYAVIDLQPGLATMLDQAKPFAELLKRPNVGLALDAEWKLKPGQRPAAQIGSADASEFNDVADWLATLTRDNDLPQKLFVLHQFNMSMIDNREKIDTSHPELAVTLHADGHGTPDIKMGTWDVLRKGLDPKIWMAWKNFYDEDTPMFTPEQTMAVQPRPWFVSYQ